MTVADALTISGSGISNSGALRGLGASANTVSGQITLSEGMDLGTGTTISVDGPAANQLILNGNVTGPGRLIKLGAGTLELGGTDANDFVGGVNVDEGVLRLNKTGAGANAAFGFNGNDVRSQGIIVGDGVGADVLTFGNTGSEQIPDDARFIIRSSGKFDLAGGTDKIISVIDLESGLTGAASITNSNTTTAATLSGSNLFDVELESGTLGNSAPITVGPGAGLLSIFL